MIARLVRGHNSVPVRFRQICDPRGTAFRYTASGHHGPPALVRPRSGPRSAAHSVRVAPVGPPPHHPRPGEARALRPRGPRRPGPKRRGGGASAATSSSGTASSAVTFSIGPSRQRLPSIVRSGPSSSRSACSTRGGWRRRSAGTCGRSSSPLSIGPTARRPSRSSRACRRVRPRETPRPGSRRASCCSRPRGGCTTPRLCARLSGIWTGSWPSPPIRGFACTRSR